MESWDEGRHHPPFQISPLNNQKEVKMKKEIEKIIKKYDSNWFYCECKSKYGNDVIGLLDEIVHDLKEVLK